MSADNPYFLPELSVSESVRNQAIATYPALGAGPHSAIYRRIFQYLLTSRYRDKTSHKLILPCQTVAHLVNVKYDHNFSARSWLDLFSDDVLPANYSTYSYTDGRARVVDPEIDSQLLKAFAEDRLMAIVEGEGRVFWSSGVPVKRHSLKVAKRQYEAFQQGQSRATCAEHPGMPIIEYALNDPQVVLEKTIRRNMPAVLALVNAMPESTEHEKDSKEHHSLLLSAINLHPKIYYAESPRTRRVHVVGESVVQLQHDIRQAMFKGEIELDLRASQLSIVSKLWHIPEIAEFLKSDRSFWQDIIKYMGLPESSKRILKTSLYSLVFGMTVENLVLQLADGDEWDKGVGMEKALHFLKHPMIEGLISARERACTQIVTDKGALDAFGCWWTIPWTKNKKGKYAPNPNSLLASTVQSYELQIMLSVMPVIESEPDLHMLLWLHDGITVHSSDSSKTQRFIDKMYEAVESEADSLGIPTYLEVTCL